ncbi:unnamed protein product [Tuber aestivum]|uniref:Uncharacterized protein n=1 Tax=Tuber aestivum TaxID=59557 RepID=A0A292PQW0_9PEZI|nr:unnamed protein product [Tuber aestivum]
MLHTFGRSISLAQSSHLCTHGTTSFIASARNIARNLYWQNINDENRVHMMSKKKTSEGEAGFMKHVEKGNLGTLEHGMKLKKAQFGYPYLSGHGLACKSKQVFRETKCDLHTRSSDRERYRVRVSPRAAGPARGVPDQQLLNLSNRQPEDPNTEPREGHGLESQQSLNKQGQEDSDNKSMDEKCNNESRVESVSTQSGDDHHSGKSETKFRSDTSSKDEDCNNYSGNEPVSSQSEGEDSDCSLIFDDDYMLEPQSEGVLGGCCRYHCCRPDEAVSSQPKDERLLGFCSCGCCVYDDGFMGVIGQCTEGTENGSCSDGTADGPCHGSCRDGTADGSCRDGTADGSCRDGTADEHSNSESEFNYQYESDEPDYYTEPEGTGTDEEGPSGLSRGETNDLFEDLVGNIVGDWYRMREGIEAQHRKDLRRLKAVWYGRSGLLAFKLQKEMKEHHNLLTAASDLHLENMRLSGDYGVDRALVQIIYQAKLRGMVKFTSDIEQALRQLAKLPLFKEVLRKEAEDRKLNPKDVASRVPYLHSVALEGPQKRGDGLTVIIEPTHYSVNERAALVSLLKLQCEWPDSLCWREE